LTGAQARAAAASPAGSRQPHLRSAAVAESDHTSRGRAADRPQQIPRPGWRDILWRVKDEASKDNLDMIAAGVAFYGLLAIFPAIAAMISIYGLIADPQTVQQQMSALSGALPSDARGIIDEQLSRVAAGARGALSAGAIIGILATLWSANKGTKALMEALNIVYDEDEKRGFLGLNLVSLALTIGILVFLIVALGLIAALPALFGNLGLPEMVRQWASWLRWPVLALVFIVSLAFLYRFAPSRGAPKWRWVSAGAVLATILWMAGSLLFSWYVSNFGSYNQTYGSVGAVIVLMMWFWLSAYIVLAGAELNAEMEHQTERDTTSGERRPRGHRGAYVADTVGEQP
jgi:membrane protein